jgi:hypothetical protein
MPVLFLWAALQSWPGQAWAADTPAERIRFQFNPPVDVLYQSTAYSHITMDMGMAGQQSSEGTVVSNIKISKTEGGYLFVTEPVSVVIKRNGDVIRDPLTQLIQESVLSVEADREGKVVSLSGYENLEKNIREKIPAEKVQALTALIKVQELSSKAAAEWESRMEGLVGTDSRLGDAWIDAREYHLPTGETVVYYARTKIESKQPCGGRDCVKIVFRYSTEAGDLEAPGQTVTRKPSALLDKDEARPGLKIRGFGSRVLEPDTMMIHSEISQKIIEVAAPEAVPGMPSMKITEKNEYHCAFP